MSYGLSESRITRIMWIFRFWSSEIQLLESRITQITRMTRILGDIGCIVRIRIGGILGFSGLSLTCDESPYYELVFDCACRIFSASRPALRNRLFKLLWSRVFTDRQTSVLPFFDFIWQL